MAIRTTVDIPDSLHEKLRLKAEKGSTSIRALIIRALEQAYSNKPTGLYVTGPPVTGKRKLGPSFPTDENPHELVLS